MNSQNKIQIIVETLVNADVDKVWKYFTEPQHIEKWNNASDEWHTPKAENDFKAGGKFTYRMEAKNGSFGFDFWGIYDAVSTNEKIEYTLGDDRKVKIEFLKEGNLTKVVETFEAENTNPADMQKTGWQMILNNFKKYVESN